MHALQVTHVYDELLSMYDSASLSFCSLLSLFTAFC